MSAFSVENSHDGKIFENYTRFEWGVELGVVAIFMLRLFVPHEFDMSKLNGTWVNTHELNNQHARKVIFTCVLCTNRHHILRPVLLYIIDK